MEHGDRGVTVTVVGDTRDPRYLQKIQSGRHSSLADEPRARGGADAGPTPFEYVLSGLGACTSITLRMYAERKGWDLGTVTVALKLLHADGANRIERQVAIDGSLNTEQRARLADICERTPVTLAVKSGIPIQTTLR